MTRIRRLVIAPVLLATLATLACATLGGPAVRRLPVLLWFEDFSTVFAGEARSTGMFNGIEMDVVDGAMKVRCVGPLQPRIVPPRAHPPTHCDGVGGVVALSCSDGRQMLGNWHAEATCGSGYGKGTDAAGNAWRLSWGTDSPRASTAAAEARKAQASKPPLPPFNAAGTGAARGPATGTAFFVTWDGHLVTNNHVIAHARKVSVRLDGDLVRAEIVDTDPENDLALLRVEAIRRPLPIGSKAKIAKGEEVFALGYPMVQLQGQEQKATFGRINSLTGISGDERLTQIDVPIQPGNSGGPLMNKRGEVVGVVTSMLNAQATMQIAGVIPQNVNYALKSHLIESLINQNLTEWEPERTRTTTAGFQQLVSENQESVVLVLAQ
ncbi:MAG: trypsin-like peptidase domain-containing protein [Deltaproteobacteria bacterium]|nr:trypsin-like peptidase domain-containing protein [Deltaproteobacteria bacterium]MBW2416383.1 trypsin-like peptidase domain-containing protein [Deltaproteobacteria bacterium]